MSNEMSIYELHQLAYVTDRIASLERLENVLKAKVRGSYPEGVTKVDTDAGTLLVEVGEAGRVSVKYEDG